jgi:hypothetical protein
MHGEKSKYYQSSPNTIYEGPFVQNRKSGFGIMLDIDEQSIYEGDFQDDKQHGSGIMYHRDGKVYTCSFKHGNIEGELQFLKIMNKLETSIKFR